MKLHQFLIPFFLVLQPTAGNGEVAIGTGLSSVLNGSHSPVLYGAWEEQNISLSLSSQGIKSPHTFLSAYLTSFLWTENLGSLLGAEISAGAGPGAFYSSRGYRSQKEENFDVHNDFNIGLTTRVSLSIVSTMFVRFEVFHGHIGDWITRRLSTRDTIYYTLGALL